MYIVILNLEQTQRTGLPKSRPGFRQQKRCTVDNNISDGDFNEIHNLFPIASSVDSYDGVQCTFFAVFVLDSPVFLSSHTLTFP